MSTIGERICALRLHRGMTQTELGEAIGETKQTIYKYEKGIVTNIPLANIEAIAKALRCPPVALTGWEKPEEKPIDEQKNDPLDETHTQLLRMFDQLAPDAQQLIIAQLRGAVLAQEEKEKRQA